MTRIQKLTGIHPILFGKDVLLSLKLSDVFTVKTQTVALIADADVAKLYAKKVLDSFLSEVKNVELYTFFSGEENKSRHTKEMIEDAMLADGMTRDSLVVALGGGVTTDIAGFIAGTYCRGVPLILIPTTLLAMADAAIGGKNGVNAKNFKNMIGTNHMPNEVIVDSTFLNTLSEAEFLSGLTEVVKHALIYDSRFFDLIENNAEKLICRDDKLVDEILVKSMKIKLEIVTKDAFELGLRRALNFGHTLGHAIEAASGYTITHGKAVAYGMIFEAKISEKMGLLKGEVCRRIQMLIEYLGLCEDASLSIDIKDIFSAIRRDKKSLFNVPRFVLLNDVGSVEKYDGQMCTTVCQQVLEEVINDMLVYQSKNM